MAGRAADVTGRPSAAPPGAARVRRLSPADAAWLDAFLVHEAIWGPQAADAEAAGEARAGAGTTLLARTDVIVLHGNEHTVLVARWLWSRVLELHVNVLPEGRGRAAVAATRACFGWLFEHTHCETLLGMPGVHRQDAARFARACGMVHEGRLPRSKRHAGTMVDRRVYALHRPVGVGPAQRPGG